jgi:hypothetical protein
MNIKIRKSPAIPIDGVDQLRRLAEGPALTAASWATASHPASSSRKSSSKDKRLKKLYNGERGLPFTPTDKL